MATKSKRPTLPKNSPATGRHCVLAMPLHLLKKKYVVENIAKLGYSLLQGVPSWKNAGKYTRDVWRKAVINVSGEAGKDNPGHALFLQMSQGGKWEILGLEAQYLWDTTARAMRLYLARGGCLARDRKVVSK